MFGQGAHDVIKIQVAITTLIWPRMSPVRMVHQYLLQISNSLPGFGPHFAKFVNIKDYFCNEGPSVAYGIAISYVGAA